LEDGAMTNQLIKNALSGVAFVLFAALGGSAYAADLIPPPAVFKAPVMAPPTWAGFYIGGNIGYGWDPASATFNPATYAATILGPLTAGTYVVTGASGPVSLSVNPQGVLGGIQGGYNWQKGSTVYGVEADFDGTGIRAATSAPFFVNGTIGGDLANFTGNVGLSQKLDYFGTVRGRVGWANDTTLLYGTGGLAWGHVTTTMNTFGITEVPPSLALTPNLISALTVSSSASDFRVGFAVGAGIEWIVVRNWSVRAEYLLVDLLGGGGTLGIPGGSGTWSWLPVQVARVGFNYHFQL
jgi:outer membrane immunogenic protein